MARISRIGREFEAEHLVEEDPAVEVRFGEAIGARIELLLALLRLEPERIELGVEMAADAVGADQHQRVDRIPRRLLHVGRRKLDALGLRLALDLVADASSRPRAQSPVSAAISSPSACGEVRPLPGGTMRVARDVGAVVLQAFEERAPFGVDRRRIGLIAGLELFDIGGVAAIKKRTAGERRVRVLARHINLPSARHLPRSGGAKAREPAHHRRRNTMTQIYDVRKATKGSRNELRFEAPSGPKTGQRLAAALPEFRPKRVISKDLAA